MSAVIRIVECPSNSITVHRKGYQPPRTVWRLPDEEIRFTRPVRLLTMQRLALFDLDNTLVDRSEAFRRWAVEFCADRELPDDALAWLIATDQDGAVPRNWFFGEVTERFGLAASVDETWRQYRRRMPELVSCPQEVLASLTLLRDDGWTVAIVTNGQADNQLGKIRRTGLDRCVDAWAVSGELGIRKPAREILEAAARGCGLDLSGGGWAIGDSPVLDVEGGRAAGLATLWVSRGKDWPAELAPPNRTVTDVVAAVRVLRGEASAEGHPDQPPAAGVSGLTTVRRVVSESPRTPRGS
ncbi:HAD family hydrolase [Micromonospora sp. NPDC049047]|uniref:HAD family hydrolase n=1 Tax=Micromonospora sp. NPDC049047 TaxID=3155645 RepID=UPI00340238D0